MLPTNITLISLDWKLIRETARRDSLILMPHRGDGMDAMCVIERVRTPITGTVKRSTHRVTLWLVNAPNTFRIKKHTAEAVK